jgi:hypothetical protein
MRQLLERDCRRAMSLAHVSIKCILASTSLCFLLSSHMDNAVRGVEPLVRLSPPALHAIPPLNVFCARRAVLTIAHESLATAPADARWSLTTVDRQALASVRAEPRGPDGTTSISVDIPPAKAGVVGSLMLRVTANNGTTTLFEQPIYSFPENPWEGHTELLKQAKLTVFDPVGKTAETLEACGVKFTRIGNSAALGADGERLILIGEGISWRDDRTLLDMLCEHARQRGAQVICLAPSDGSWNYSESLATASEVNWRRHPIISQRQPMLDPRWWRPLGPGPCRGLEPKGEGISAIWEVSESPLAWPWVEAQFAPSDGRLTICGFSILSGWNDSPTPRYLLAGLLEEAANRVLSPLHKLERKSEP